MRIPVLFTVLLAAVLAATPLRQATAQQGGGEVSFNLFYDNLADDGDWYNTPEYGYVWQPDIAYKNDKWRPYSDGYWAQTDGGWTWVSYENFGWATYHYGRWTRLKDIGWAWVPGYDWGPGWVSWRTNDDYVGWAPLPPKSERGVYEGKVVETRRAEAVDYNDVEDESEGYTSNVDENYDIGPDNYCFVETRSFGAPVLSEVVLPYDRNVTFIGQTRNVTNIYYERDNDNVFVYNGGPDYAFISGRCERPIQRLQIERRRDPGFLALGLRAGGNPTQVHGGILQVAAPLITRGPVNFAQMKPVHVKQNLERSDVVHGWSGPGVDQQAAQRVRAQFKEQAQQAPAKAFEPKERLVQSLPADKRIVTKSDLPPAPPKDMAPEAVAARRAQRQQARAAQGGQAGARPGQAGFNAQPQPNVQPGQPGQPNANEKRPGAMTEQDRVARREAAQKARESRDQGRANGQPAAGQPAQPGQPGVNGQNGQPKDNSDEAKAARRAQRQQERAGQANPGQGGAEAAGQPSAQSKDNSDEAKAARRAQRQQERAGKQTPAQEAQPNAGQPAQEQSKPQADQDREARRAQRQQERAQKPEAQPQQAAAQPDADREARRAQRQQERAQQQQAQPQEKTEQPDADREARRAQRQQERAAQPQPQAQQSGGDQEREARRAQRQQEQAQQPQQQAQQQGNQEREAHRAQRQQEPQAQPQPQAQQQPQAQGGGNADRDARRAQRQAEKGKQGDNKPDQ